MIDVPMDWSEYIAKSIPCRVTPVDGRRAVWLDGGSVVEHVAGEQYYQTQLMQIVAGRYLPLSGPAWLVPEHDNAFDNNAVRVVINDLKVGYLPRDRAALWQPVLEAISKQHQCYVACMAQIVVTGESRQLDVVLYVPIHLSMSARDQYVSALRAAENEAFERQRLEQEELRKKQWAAQQTAEREARKQRRDELTARFGEETASRILRGEIWQGATREIIEEAHGKPCDVDEKVMKTKMRHVLKYRPVGTNRYALRITLDDGVVVGWEGKGSEST